MNKRWAQLERQRQRLEVEALRLYRPSPLQLPFHQATERELVLRGGKRSGKTIAAAMEFASRVLGVPIIDPDGNELPLKYPVSTPENPLQFWVIGYDTSHAATMHRILFQRGMGGTLRAIRDAQTGEWRIWNRANPEDAARIKESVLTEPIIPQRFWAGGEDETFTWTEKKAHEWHSFRLANHALVYYWPSSARSPKQGEAVAGIFIDEDIQFPHHLPEWQDRLTDHDGWFMWSAWPHDANPALSELLDRAEREMDLPKPRIRAFRLIMSQNPFITAEGREAALARMGTEDEIARRDRGELGESYLMYDFDPGRHLVRKLAPHESLGDCPDAKRVISHLYSKLGYMPHEWTRYLSIDPSHTRTACHSFAVPPPTWENVDMRGVVVVEWELIVEKHSARMLAKALRPLMAGRDYEAFIMDRQIGRQTNAARDDTVFEAYAEAFEEAGLHSRLTHSGFIPGCSEPATRYRCVREMLTVQENGLPMALFLFSHTATTQKEFGTYRRKKVTTNGIVTVLDQPANPRVHDAMASLEYGLTYLLPLVKSGTAYHPSGLAPAGQSQSLYARFKAMMERYKQETQEYVHLGPGSAA